MELLAGYASSSSSSNSSCCSLSLIGLGNNGQGQTQTSGSTCRRTNSGAAGKRQLIERVSVAHETSCSISACAIEKRRRLSDNRHNHDQCTMPKFERNHPHWEGRWVGHLHLPFPPIEHLDSCPERRIHDQDGLNVNGTGKGRPTDYGIDIQKNGDAGCIDDGSDSSSCSSDEESDELIQQSRMFLPTARKLIHHWQMLLTETRSGDYYDEINNSTFKDDQVMDGRSQAPTAPVVVPHIPMHPIESALIPTTSSFVDETTTTTTTLHISLARPIYLPSPSVDSFLTCIENSIQAVVKHRGDQRQSSGRILHLQPRNATIFTNDQQNRSFLSIPISKESSRWVKQTLLPPIDATMVRFGLETYYHNHSSLEGGDEEGCILHVSVASVKGNVIPQLLLQHLRNNTKHAKSSTMHNVEARSVRSLPLFLIQEGDQHNEEEEEEEDVCALLTTSIPVSIPIRFDRVQCTFGKDKQLTIPV